MLTPEKAKELKQDLFSIVRYCHDNEKDFLKNIVSIDCDQIESLNAVYLSGSSALILLSHWHCDELYEKTIPVVTQSLLEWVINHQNN